MKKINALVVSIALLLEIILVMSPNNVYLSRHSLKEARTQINESINNHRSLDGFSQIGSQQLVWDESLAFSIHRSDIQITVTLFLRELGNVFDYLVVIDYLWLLNPDSDRDQFFIGYDPRAMDIVGFSLRQNHCVSHVVGQVDLHLMKCKQSDRLEYSSMGLIGWGIDYENSTKQLITRESIHWGIASFIIRSSKKLESGDVLFAYQFIDNYRLLSQDRNVYSIIDGDDYSIPSIKVIASDRQRYLSGLFRITP